MLDTGSPGKRTGVSEWDAIKLDALNLEVDEAMHKLQHMHFRIAEIDNKVNMLAGGRRSQISNHSR